jgi:tetratricopeptide (TPR) repeat protein
VQPPGSTTGGDPAVREEQLLGEALHALRRTHDPATALRALDAHTAGFPAGHLRQERELLRSEALVALHRDPEALAVLDALELEALPASGYRLLVRGELRARAGRWRQAIADLELALAAIESGPDRALLERALWARTVARQRNGDAAGARTDCLRLLGLHPEGQFAADAARLCGRPR